MSFDQAGAEAFRPGRAVQYPGGDCLEDYLEFDELLSRGGNDFTVEVDSEGSLDLIEGEDFD